MPPAEHVEARLGQLRPEIERLVRERLGCECFALVVWARPLPAPGHERMLLGWCGNRPKLEAIVAVESAMGLDLL